MLLHPFSVPSGDHANPLHTAIAAVSTTHASPNQSPLHTPLYIFRARLKDPVDSKYFYEKDTGKPQSIAVSISARHPELETVSRIGNLYDHQAFDEAGSFASEDSTELEAWRRAVEESDAVQMLKYLQTQEKAAYPVPSGDIATIRINHELVDTYLPPRELMGRAYAQYVAIIAKGTVLEQLDEIRRDNLSQVYSIYWEDHDFAPIAHALEAILRRKHWIA